MIAFARRDKRTMPAALALLSCAVWHPASAQETGEDDEQQVREEAQPAEDIDVGDDTDAEDSGSGTDIFSADTFVVQIDGRLVLADGANSWIDGGFGKTRFDGTDDGHFEFDAYPVEASLI